MYFPIGNLTTALYQYSDITLWSTLFNSKKLCTYNLSTLISIYTCIYLTRSMLTVFWCYIPSAEYSRTL